MLELVWCLDNISHPGYRRKKIIFCFHQNGVTDVRPRTISNQDNIKALHQASKGRVPKFDGFIVTLKIESVKRPQNQRTFLRRGFHVNTYSYMSAVANQNSNSQYSLCITQIVAKLIETYDQGTSLNFTKLKSTYAQKYKIKGIPKITDVIAALPPSHKKELLPFLKAKPVRTASGVAVVAVMCKPHRCPHIAMTKNVCVYCPGGPDSDFEYSTQAYTGYEPTSMR